MNSKKILVLLELLRRTTFLSRHPLFHLNHSMVIVYIMSTLRGVRAGLFSTIVVFLLVSQIQSTDWLLSGDDPGVSLSVSILNSSNNLIVEPQR